MYNKEASKRYYDKHRDLMRLRSKEYYLENREQEIEKRRLWREKNKELLPEMNRKYKQSHKESVAKNKKKWRDENKEKLRIILREWRKNNREKCNEHYNQRKARERGNGYKKYSRIDIYERDGWICGLCGKKINKRTKYPNKLCATIDHIVPVSLGGGDMPSNVQACHLKCNYEKRAKNIGQLRLF